VSSFVSISGSGKADVTVFGNGTVVAGNGHDKIDITGVGKIVIGSGNDTLTLGKGGTITEHGVSGHDTIHIGSTGVYTIHEQGLATVTGAFGSATVNGGTLKIIESPGHAAREIVTGGHVTIAGAQSTAVGAHGSTGQTSHGTTGVTHGTNGVLHDTHMHGHSTLLGGAHTTEFASGHAGLAFTKAGMGADSMGGSTHSAVFELYDKASPAFLKSFVAGQDHLYLPGHSLAFVAQPHEISTQGDKTMISMDGGKTMIALHGIHVSGDKH
jgi:hypothetical protein